MTSSIITKGHGSTTTAKKKGIEISCCSNVRELRISSLEVICVC
ncbi:MAG TPA: hypothetical protein VE076_02095 [Nitrososphaeraceae archaeon]|nr:hypothetical protein [Nitrososphaeraceae archaeon]